jgi:hypothetical protein
LTGIMPFSTHKIILIASTLMLLAGWVHRDISGGNLLRYEERGILSDLEYARRYTNSHEASKEPKTVSWSDSSLFKIPT